MVGLLGTVLGIIKSFGSLGAESCRRCSRNMALAGGVSEALVATASGLVLGIIAMAFYALFRNRVQSPHLRISRSRSTHVLGLLALNYSKNARAIARRRWTRDF